MFFLTAFFLLGAVTINVLPNLLPMGYLCLLALFGIALLCFVQSIWLRCLACFLLGTCWTQWAASDLPWFDPNYHQQRMELNLSGFIASIPQKQARSVRFIFATEKGNFYLNWYGQYRLPKPGEQWHLKIRLVPVKQYYNEAGFDMIRWLMLQKVHAKGYVLYDKNNRLLHDTGYQSYPLLRYRFDKQQHLSSLKPPHWEIIAGLTLGAREAISDEVWQLLRKTNTSHLLAISGLHVGMITGIVFITVQFIVRHFAFLTSVIPAHIFASYAGILAALSYALVAGWSVPTQRAFIMISVALLAVICRSRLSIWQSLLCAVWVVLLIQPLAVMSIGFALSFLATFSLIYALSQRRFVRFAWLRTQWAVTLFLLPWVLVFFKELALLGWCVNFIAIPYVSFFLLPLALIAVFSPIYNELLLHIVGRGIDYLLDLLLWFADLPILTWYNPNHGIWILMISVLALVLMMMPRGIPGRYFSVWMLMPLILQSPARVPFGEAYIHFLDVGHGLAVVVRTTNHNLVYDVGEPFVTQSVLMPFLQQQGVKRLDKIVISHLDFDHVGAINELLFYYPKTKLESSEWLHTQYHTDLCRKGQAWIWDGVHFSYLHPDEKHYPKRNDRSCILKIETDQRALLLTGDIGQRIEKKLIEQGVKSDVFLIPHHGSASASSTLFLNGLAGKEAVLSAYRPLRKSVMRRYLKHNIKVWSTNEGGQINLFLKPRKILFKSYRQMTHKLWYDMKP